MIDIYYLGDNCFRIKGKKTSLVIDPFSDKLGIKFPKTESEIVLYTNAKEESHTSSGVSGLTLVIDGPGEYEIKGVSIIGFSTEKGQNTIFKMVIDNVKFAHLGALKEKLNTEIIEELEDVHVLMVPVGGKDTIDFKALDEIIKGVEPRIVIPMHYQTSKYNKDLLPLSDFIKNSGLEPQKVIGKLSIAREKLPEQRELHVFD